MSDNDFKPGDRCGPNYVIEKLIGKGGQGLVYRARHTFTNRLVAIKVCSIETSGRADSRERLAREARALAKADHPNIVAIYDGGITDEGVVFIVMEHLKGTTLRALLDTRSGPLPLTEALVYGRDISGAVAALHAAKILHRDLKPENVFVLPDGVVKIIDFGLVRLRDEAAQITVKLPDVAAIMGSPHYMSPEQIMGAEVGEPTDVYTTGLIIHEMISGKFVFQRDTGVWPAPRLAMQNHHFATPPRLGDLVHGVPDELSRLVLRALSKNPDDRPNANELCDELRAILRGLPQREDVTTAPLPASYGDDSPRHAEPCPRVPAAQPDSEVAARHLRSWAVIVAERFVPMPRWARVVFTLVLALIALRLSMILTQHFRASFMQVHPFGESLPTVHTAATLPPAAPTPRAELTRSPPPARSAAVSAGTKPPDAETPAPAGSAPTTSPPRYAPQSRRPVGMPPTTKTSDAIERTAEF